MAFDEFDEIPEDLNAEPQTAPQSPPIVLYALAGGLVLLIALLALSY